MEDRKEWTTPELVVHGSVEDITEEMNGGGFTQQGS